MQGTSSQHDTADSARMIHIPDLIPIFPLPKTVLLPGEVLPLHIFETRYRDMTRDALASNRVIGICQVSPGFEEQQPGKPPLLKTGCVGFIGRHEQLDDGRFMLWLFGLARFEISEEIDAGTSYRQARVCYSGEDPSAEELTRLQPLRHELRGLLPRLLQVDDEHRNTLAEQLGEVSDSQLIALASQVLELPHGRKRKILEAATDKERFNFVFEDIYAHLELNPELDELDPGTLN